MFVAVLGASNYTYAEATWSQAKPDWIGAQVRALTYIGGVPELLVPDNPKALIAEASRYEPEPNRMPISASAVTVFNPELRRFASDDHGGEVIEYVLILGLIVVATITTNVAGRIADAPPTPWAGRQGNPGSRGSYPSSS